MVKIGVKVNVEVIIEVIMNEVRAGNFLMVDIGINA